MKFAYPESESDKIEYAIFFEPIMKLSVPDELLDHTRCHDPICIRRGGVVGSVAEDRSNEAIHRG